MTNDSIRMTAGHILIYFKNYHRIYVICIYMFIYIYTLYILCQYIDQSEYCVLHRVEIGQYLLRQRCNRGINFAISLVSVVTIV